MSGIVQALRMALNPEEFDGSSPEQRQGHLNRAQDRILDDFHREHVAERAMRSAEAPMGRDEQLSMKVEHVHPDPAKGTATERYPVIFPDPPMDLWLLKWNMYRPSDQWAVVGLTVAGMAVGYLSTARGRGGSRTAFILGNGLAGFLGGHIGASMRLMCRLQGSKENAQEVKMYGTWQDTKAQLGEEMKKIRASLPPHLKDSVGDEDGTFHDPEVFKKVLKRYFQGLRAQLPSES